MPTEVYWIEQHSILCLECSGNVGEEEINVNARRILEAAEQQATYVLLDFTRVTSLPRNLIHVSFRSEAISRMLQHPRIRAFAFVGVSHSARLSLEFVMRSQIIAWVDTRREGIAFLRRQMGRAENED